MSYKKPEVEQMDFSQCTYASIVLYELSEYFGKYQISFQFWGKGNYNVFIEKDGVDLWDSDNHETPLAAMIATRDYLDRINNNKREYNPNF